MLVWTNFHTCASPAIFCTSHWGWNYCSDSGCWQSHATRSDWCYHCGSLALALRWTIYGWDGAHHPCLSRSTSRGITRCHMQKINLKIREVALNSQTFTNIMTIRRGRPPRDTYACVAFDIWSCDQFTHAHFNPFSLKNLTGSWSYWAKLKITLRSQFTSWSFEYVFIIYISQKINIIPSLITSPKTLARPPV